MVFQLMEQFSNGLYHTYVRQKRPPMKLEVTFDECK